MKTFIKWTAWGAGIVVVVFCVAAIGSRLFSPKKAVAQAPSIPTVAVQDLAKAGFTGSSIQPPVGGRFQPPTYYFRVKESSDDSGWKEDGVANLVAVNIFPTPWATAAVTDANATNDLSGRANVCGSRVGVYFCVIGPDQKKGEALLNILKAK